MPLRDALLGILAALIVLGLGACVYERRWVIFFFALVVFSGLGLLVGYELRHTG